MELPDVKELEESHLIDEHSLRLDVIVHCGRNLTQSYWRSITSLGMDRSVDPYVQLTVTRPAQHFKDFAEESTVSKDDEPNPVWEELLSFIINAEDGIRGDLKVVVWDDNYGPDTQYSNDIIINLSTLKLSSDYQRRTLDLGSGAEIDISLRLDRMKLDMRLGHKLHPNEVDTVAKRKVKCAEAISKLIGRKISPEKAPVVSVVGSGGGFRAMTAMSGATQGLKETSVLDCCTYFAALSGSTWYLSQLYTTDGGPDVYKCADHLKEHVSHMEEIMQITNAGEYIPIIYQRYLDGLNISLVDLWECYLSSIFEPDKKKVGAKKVSQQRPHVETAELPFPIYTALHVAEEVKTQTFAEWIEFTPYEYGINNYGSFMKIEDIAATKCRGVVCRRYKELDQTVFIAIWGSAFAASIEVIANNTLGSTKKSFFKSLMELLFEKTSIDDMRPFAASLPNMLYGLKRRMLWRVVNTAQSVFASLPTSLYRLVSQSDETDAPPSAVKPEDHQIEGLKKGKRNRAGPRITRADDKKYRSEQEMMVVDGGLAFNDPFPPLLRAERHTDVFIVFDFSWRDDQTMYPFKELEKAASWAEAYKFKFPKIDPNQFDKDNLKECYVFEDEKDPECPIIIFFPLCNASRQHTTIKGQDETYTNLNPFSKPYGTTHFAMSADEFDRLKELNRYNATKGFDAIKQAIEKKVRE
eukprot:m.307353 g.307353  ORF g.307353 m.307353 type:complete len:695 (+) comp42183_c0_seq1:54-2138(+)